MKKQLNFTLLLLFLFLIISSNQSLSAQEINKEMREVYTAFKELQIYPTTPEKFESGKDHPEIQSLIETVSKNFHMINENHSRFQKEAGFSETAKLVQEMLDDSLLRFKEGNKSYSLWRLRGLTNHCVTCHVTYNVDLTFHDTSTDVSKLTPIEKANFYFASRQFKKASDAYLESIEANQVPFENIDALRKWLIVQVRVNDSPQEAEKTLTAILPKLDLPTYDKEEVSSWITSLKKWASSGKNGKELSDAERLIRQSISIDPLSETRDEVSILRATAILHSILPKLKSKEDRARALYLLGLCYNKVSLFFIDELPEMYLRLSIEELPGSATAKAAFQLYKDIVTLSFTGSMGTNLPTDVKLKLIELHKKAYGIPNFSGKV